MFFPAANEGGGTARPPDGEGGMLQHMGNGRPVGHRPILLHGKRPKGKEEVEGGLTYG